MRMVASDVPEHREVLGDAGLYFEAAKPETLAARMLQLVAEPGAARELGRRAAAAAHERYDSDAVTRPAPGPLFEQAAFDAAGSALPRPRGMSG